MSSDVADVRKKGVPAARLYREGNALVFQYRQDYIDAGGAPVATTLPISSQPLALPGGTSPAFFAGLLPEGRRLNAIRTRIKTSADNDLALLLEIGQDLVGDVQVLAQDADPDTSRDYLEIPNEVSRLDFNAIRDEYFGHRASGLPGMQDKVSGKMMNARTKTAEGDYLVKFNPDDVPFAVENEAYFLALAKKCGIKVSKFTVLEDSRGVKALRLERFDRPKNGNVSGRLAVEDGCQALNLYPADKYDLEFSLMAQKLISLCPGQAAAGFNLFKQLVFSWLSGNGDAHAKNFSVLESSLGDFAISPAYDLLCTAFYANDRTMSLTIDGKNTGWNRQTMIEAAKLLHVPEKLANQVIDHQLKILKAVPDALVDHALPFPSHLNYAVAKFLKKRLASLAE